LRAISSWLSIGIYLADKRVDALYSQKESIGKRFPARGRFWHRRAQPSAHPFFLSMPGRAEVSKVEIWMSGLGFEV